MEIFCLIFISLKYIMTIDNSFFFLFDFFVVSFEFANERA